METSLIAGLLAPFLDDASVLSSTQLEQISTYIDLLVRWNSRVNLTAIRTPEQIVTRHFGESLFAARRLFPQSNAASPRSNVAANAAHSDPGRTEVLRSTATFDETAAPVQLMDLGSGAGFPGLPIKIWSPPASVTLVESNHKKVAFLREVTRALRLTDINVISIRAEDVPAGSARTVTVRAVEQFTLILPIAVRLLVPTGRLALLIGNSQVEVAKQVCANLSWSRPESLPNSRETVLLVGHSKE
jgi:16S rRNA (guanine527-N7)-methyltransferase